MLNRLFIVVGGVAILAIIALFALPFFVDWSAYKPRLEAMVSEALGTEARVEGDIYFTLLPQPHLKADTIVVGPAASPLVEIEAVEAELVLTDFLRDRYSVSSLTLNRPKLYFSVDADGQFAVPLAMPETVSATNVSVEDAAIANGEIHLTDGRSGAKWSLTGFDGSLQMGGMRGPFSLNGTGMFDDRPHIVRVNTSARNAADELQVAAFARAADEGYSITVDGLLSTRGRLEFAGSTTLRQTPAQVESADGVRGDLVFTSQVEANTERVLLTDFTVEPDENRPATRLTGAAVLNLGASPNFDAVVSSGVIALPPREASADAVIEPYEVLRLLGELPAPIVPPLPGRIGLDITELDLRGLSLRDVRLDAETDGEVWLVENFLARMAGNAQLSLEGTLAVADTGGPAFDGSMTLDARRLDTFALQWRRAAEDNPLFNMPGSLSGRVGFADDALTLVDGEFLLDGEANNVEADIQFGETQALSVAAQLGQLDDGLTRALQALLPEVSNDARFRLSFPQGDFDVRAAALSVGGLSAENVTARGAWDETGITFNRFGTDAYGGARFGLSGSFNGNWNDPVVTAAGQVSLSATAANGVLPQLFDRFGLPGQMRDFATRSLPAELSIDLNAREGGPGQALIVTGRLGAGDVDAAILFDDGLFNPVSEPISVDLALTSQDSVALSRQLGLGDVALMPDGSPVSFQLLTEGTPLNSLETTVSLSGGGDEIAYAGNVIPSDLSALRGRGQLTFDLSDSTVVASALGAEGIGFGPVSGKAEFSFNGLSTMSLQAIDVNADGAFLSGELGRTQQGENVQFSGALRSSTIDVSHFAALLGGPSALLNDGLLWPDGPFAYTDQSRRTSGRIAIETPFVTHAGRDLATDAKFDFTWDATNVRLRGLEAAIGGGTMGLELEICCTGVDSAKQIEGRATFAGVDIDALLPEAPAAVIDGTLGGGLTFSGTGDSFASVLSGLAGDGSFTLEGIEISEFGPGAFAVLADMENVIELEPEVLTGIVEDALGQGRFTAPEAGGVFTIAAGRARLSNMAIEGPEANIFGGAALSLGDLGLSGEWTMTPTDLSNPDALINETNARATAILSGTLIDPEHRIDVAPMIDAIKVRAYELEVDRLEQLRAEEEARARAAAAERARLMELQARQQAEEEFARLRAEEAERLARQQAAAEEAAEAEAAAEQAAEDEAPAELLGPPPPDPNAAPIDLLQEGLNLPEPAFENNSVFQPFDLTGDELINSFE